MGSKLEHFTTNETYQPTNQPTTISIKRGKKQSLFLYGIDDNMHPQKQKSKVSHENVIGKPKHFHWKPMCNEQLETLMITFPSSTLKEITKKFIINNSTLELRFIQVYSHLCHLHKKNVNLVKNINSSLNMETSTNTNVGLNDIPQTHSLEKYSHENPQFDILTCNNPMKPSHIEQPSSTINVHNTLISNIIHENILTTLENPSPHHDKYFQQ
jgi:hypothetical protein